MIKKIVYPFQKVLLNRKMCVGCTHPLEKLPNIYDLNENRFLLQCKCKRRYVYDKSLGTYRRATFEEERLFIEAKNK